MGTYQIALHADTRAVNSSLDELMLMFLVTMYRSCIVSEVFLYFCLINSTIQKSRNKETQEKR